MDCYIRKRSLFFSYRLVDEKNQENLAGRTACHAVHDAVVIGAKGGSGPELY
jgi:hypothetical protein